jgi:serine/threonine protein kinase
MISFPCSHCGLKLTVKLEFAGRASRCPTCKQPLVVPAPDKTHAEVASGQIDGADSSLAKAGVEGEGEGGVTLEPKAAAARPGWKSVQELLAGRARNGGRYIVEGEIARGGMGCVLRAVDCDIRREVAVKYLLDQTDAGKKARFVEEAQITGQLEHPNIVPIHELGVDALKRLFFSMKMVKGRSLAQVVEELRRQPKAAEKEWPLGRLLNIFINTCHALAYAHARGVIHRDLKPANIMIGDFGEVYVMDWGLAKVLKAGQAGPPLAAARTLGRAVAPVLAVPTPGSSISRSSQIETSREAEADLTQEGAVLGTPVYMPPEQAAGHVEAIDQRSDVYALGAILYELLTLQPPIDKEGGYLAILMRVMQGEIMPPEQRVRQPGEPGRVSARSMPKELAAIAMKAMARQPADRYPRVEALRRDVERFMEGRSVSAKPDTAREMAWKLVKRNKLASAFTTLLAVVLVWSSWTNWQARNATARAYADFQAQVNKSVPTFVQSARLSVQRKEFAEALGQLDVVLKADEDHAQARLLKGQILIVLKDFSQAQAELDRYLKLNRTDADAQELAALCRKGKPEDIATLYALADVLGRMKAGMLSEQLVLSAGSHVAAKQKLLAVYQQRIEADWPGLGKRLSLDEQDGAFVLNLVGQKQLINLAPVQGMPVSRLDLSGCDRLRDLTPLQGMPLTSLDITTCAEVSDLTPLQGMPLRTLKCGWCRRITDLTPLRNTKLTTLSMPGCSGVRDLTPLQHLPLTMLEIWDCNQAQDFKPLQGLKLVEIDFVPKNITQGLEVIRQMKSLKTIRVRATMRFTPDDFWKRFDAGEFK